MIKILPKVHITDLTIDYNVTKSPILKYMYMHTGGRMFLRDKFAEI